MRGHDEEEFGVLRGEDLEELIPTHVRIEISSCESLLFSEKSFGKEGTQKTRNMHGNSLNAQSSSCEYLYVRSECALSVYSALTVAYRRPEADTRTLDND